MFRSSALLLSLLFLLPRSLPASAQLVQAFMTKTVPASDCSVPPSATSFTATDSAAYLWFMVSGMNAGDTVGTAYYTPAGQYYADTSGDFVPVPSSGTYCFADNAFQIAGAAPAKLPGQWKVYIYYNGVQLGTVTFTITAAASCTYTLNPASASAIAAGGNGSFTVSAGTGCSWTATSSAAWLTTSSSGSGNGTVSYTAAANTAASSRTGTISAGGQTFTLTQAGASGGSSDTQLYTNYNSSACSLTGSSQFTLANAANVTRFGVWYNWAAGETGVSATVKQGTNTVFSGSLLRSSCDPYQTSWCNAEAPINAAWPAGAYTVAISPAHMCMNSGSSNQGFVYIYGTWQSTASCSYSLSSTSASPGASGGTGTVNVTAGAGCAWTAVSNAAWITITAGASGTGNGTVGYSVAANTGAARTGTVTIGGQAFTVNQAAGSGSNCNYFVQPLTQTIPAAGGTGIIVQVFTSQGCAWTAVSNAPWITIIAGASGSGNGAVSYTIPVNPGTSSRVGTVTIAGQTHTVTQLGSAATCNYTVTPGSWDLTAAGGEFAILVTTDASCSWTAASGAGWIATSSQNGTGTTRAYFTAQANSSSAARSATLTVAGQTVTVNQAAGGAPCGYTAGPTTWNLAAAATSGAVVLSTGANCSWSASSTVPWIAIASPSSGTGTATISFSAQANTTPSPRTGILAVAGQAVTLVQAAAPPPTPAGAPAISDGGLVNAASNRAGTLARGSFFTIYGANLGPAQPSQATSYPIPDTMGGIVVNISQGSATKRAYLHFVSATQVNAIVPSAAPLGDVQIAVTYNGATSASATATVVDSNFGAFSAAGGIGPGIIQNYVSASVQPLNMPSMPAKPGQIAILWGTGLGPISQADNQPPAGGSMSVPVSVEVGGKSAKILYSGRAPSFAAVDNVYFEVPADAPLGCSVPVRVKAGDNYGNTVRMAISAAGDACQDTANPFSGMTTTGATSGSIVLVRAALAGQLQFGQPAVDTTFDLGLAMFTETSAGGALGFSAALNLPPLGACTSNTKTLDFTSLFGGSVYSTDASVKRELDAGTDLKIAGPNGSSTLHHMNTTSNTGPYLAVLGGTVPMSGAPSMPPFLEAGALTVTGTGGKDVGAFTASLTMPASVTWTNKSAIGTVDRTVPLNLTWTGGDPAETVVIAGVVSDSKSKKSGGFACLVAASAGQFTVPASILADLPPTRPLTGTDDTLGAIALGVLPLTNLPRFGASGLTSGYGIAGSISVKTVQVK